MTIATVMLEGCQGTRLGTDDDGDGMFNVGVERLVGVDDK